MRTTVLRKPLARAALSASIIVGACQPPPEATVVENATPALDRPLPSLPVAEPPLDRAALLQAIARAASAAALGKSDAEAQRDMDGDRFELRIRFGCPGGASRVESESFDVRFDSETRTLRLRAAPDLRIDDSWMTALAGETAEAVEGFWLRRPWLLAAGCPAIVGSPPDAVQSPPTASKPAETVKAAPALEQPPPAPIQRIGIAQFFTDTDARTGQRGDRAYEATKKLAADEQPSGQGYDLAISGRLARLPDGRVIACRARTADMPPDCIVSVDIDRVRIDRPDTGAVIAEWSA